MGGEQRTRTKKIKLWLFGLLFSVRQWISPNKLSWIKLCYNCNCNDTCLPFLHFLCCFPQNKCDCLLALLVIARQRRRWWRWRTLLVILGAGNWNKFYLPFASVSSSYSSSYIASHLPVTAIRLFQLIFSSIIIWKLNSGAGAIWTQGGTG